MLWTCGNPPKGTGRDCQAKSRRSGGFGSPLTGQSEQWLRALSHPSLDFWQFPCIDRRRCSLWALLPLLAWWVQSPHPCHLCFKPMGHLKPPTTFTLVSVLLRSTPHIPLHLCLSLAPPRAPLCRAGLPAHPTASPLPLWILVTVGMIHPMPAWHAI